MQPEILTKRYFLCPECGKGEHEIEHLMDNKQSFGPWRCRNEDCRAILKGQTDGAGGVEIEIEESDRFPTYSLLKLRDLYLVVHHDVIGDKDGNIDNWDFFFHSHQCPTNLFRSVEEVYDHEEDDPHGLMRFVTSIPATAEIRKKLQNARTTPSMLELFNSNGIPLKGSTHNHSIT